MNGFRDALSLGEIDSIQIEEIEQYARTKLQPLLQNLFGCPLPANDLVFFFGQFAHEPSNFEFLSGDKIVLKKLESYINNVLAKHEYSYFASERQEFEEACNPNAEYFKENDTFKCKIQSVDDLCGKFKAKLYDKMIETLKKLNQSNSIDYTSLNADMVEVLLVKEKLLGKVVCAFCKKDGICKKLAVRFQEDPNGTKYWVLGNFTNHLEMVHKAKSIKIKSKKEKSNKRNNRNKLLGNELNRHAQSEALVQHNSDSNIKCELSADGNAATIPFETKQDEYSGLDFDNCDAAHSMERRKSTRSSKQPTKIRRTEALSEQEANNLNIVEELLKVEVEVKPKPAIDLVENYVQLMNDISKYEASLTKLDLFSDFDLDAEFFKREDKNISQSTTLHQEMNDIEEMNESPHDTSELSMFGENSVSAVVHAQISQQMLNIRNSELKESKNHRPMNFIINNEEVTIKVAPTNKDNSCLFRALAHQLFYESMHSKKQNKAVANLRASVVDFIESNFEEFVFELKNSIYDKDPNIVITDSKQACKLFLIDLRSDTEWGGAETMKAVSMLYNVNIIIINEMGSVHISNFNEKHNKCVIIAYRLASGDNKLVRNHYDSVVHIHETDIFSSKKECVVSMCDNLIKRQIAQENDSNKIIEV